MSEKFEPCTLEEAIHFEIHGVIHSLNDNVQYSCNGTRVGIRLREEDVFIPEDAFPLLGIKCLRKVKPEPIVFEAIVRQDMPFAYLSNVPDGIPLGTKFKCVQIMEEEE
jgi:hypothetical protein